MLTVYRNTKYLVLFPSEMDMSSLTLVVRKMGPGGKKNEILKEMLSEIMSENRYVIIRSDKSDLRYMSDLFGEKSFSKRGEDKLRYIKVFTPIFNTDKHRN